MQINSRNHGNGENELFGLLPDRLLFKGGRKAPEGLPGTTLDKQKDEIKAIETQREAFEKQIKKAITDYNKKLPSGRRERRNKPFLEPLKTDIENPTAIVAQIDRILIMPYEYEDERYSLLSPANNEDKKRSKELLTIRGMLTGSKEVHDEKKKTILIDKKFLKHEWSDLWEDNPLNKISIDRLPKSGDELEATIHKYRYIAEKRMAPILMAYEKVGDKRYRALEKAYNQILLQIILLKTKPSELGVKLRKTEGSYVEKSQEALHLRGQRLVDRINIIRSSKEKSAEWESKPAYQDIKSAFDRAKEAPEYAGMFRLSDGEISNASKREMEMLFMTIVAQETNNFDNAFVLGSLDEFGEDHEENRKKFPFIYNEWLKENGIDLKAGEVARERVNSTFASIMSSYPPVSTVEEIIKKYRGEVAIERSAKKIEEIKKKQSDQDHKIRTLDQIFLSKEAHDAEMLEIHRMKNVFLDAAAKETEYPQKKEDYKKVAKDLKKWERLANEKKLYFGKLKSKKGAEVAFTRSELNKPQNLQLLVEIAMKKFMKAKKMVDQPFEKDDWRKHYHPTIRRLLISTVYREGVSEFQLTKDGKRKYVENLNEDHYWMLKEMVKSKYFNRLMVGKHMSPEHRKVLLVSRIANTVAIDLEAIKEAKALLPIIIEIRNAPQDQWVALAKSKGLGKYSPRLVRNYMDSDISIPQLEAKLIEAQQDEVRFTEFLEKARDAIRDPYSKESTEFFEMVASNHYVWTGPDGKSRRIISEKELKAFKDEMHKIEFDYNIFEFDHESRMQYFERLGIRIEGIYPAYLAALKKNPDMDVANWEDHFSGDKKQFLELKDFLGKILSDSNSEIREDFLAVFETLHGYDSLEKLPDTLNDQASAIAIFTMIKMTIMEEEKYRGVVDRGEAEALAKREGMTIGDKIEEYGRGVFDMAFGSGQSWTNRAAGAVIIFGVLKMAKKAWRGDDNIGKALRGLFIIGAAELGFKHVTGTGILEKYLGLETMLEAIAGSKKAALIDYSSEYMQEREIAPEQQAAALYELDKASFKDVLTWYNSANKESGEPREKGQKDLFSKLNIDTSNIIKGVTWDKRNEELEAKRVVMHTVRQFFGYVGRKEHKGEEDGVKMLEDRWIEMIENPDYKPEHTEFGLANSLVAELRANPSRLTWNMVFENEIDLKHAKDTQKKYGLDPYTEYLSGAYDGFRSWTLKHLEGPLRGHAKSFFEELGDKAGEVKEFLGEVGESLGRKLEFTKDEVSFWFEGNQYKIRRFLGMHWELVKEGVKLPFGIIYQADQVVVPWTLNKLRQLKSIAERTEFDTIEGRDLYISDIIDPQRIGLLGTADQSSLDLNDKYSFYGLYQNAFTNAYLNGYLGAVGITDIDVDTLSVRQKTNLANKAQPEELPPGKKMEIYYETSGAGYYVTETTLEDVGIDPYTSPLSPDSWFNKMNEESHNQATLKFRENPEIRNEDIEDFMYSVHVIKKTTKPQKLYTFWRMPLPGGPELELKRLKKWPDYYNPNALKERPPFHADSTKSYMENLKDAFTKSIDPAARDFVGDVAKWAQQIPRLAFGTLELIGKTASGAVGIFSKRKGDKVAETLAPITERSPGTRQGFDEVSSAAADPGWAMSAFYKDKTNKYENSRTYRALLEYARHRRHSPYLEIFQDNAFQRRGKPKLSYASDWYTTDMPADFSYVDFETWYNRWKTKPGNGTLHKLEIALRTRVRDEQRGQ